MSSDVAAIQPRKAGLVARMAERFGVDADKMLTTLKATAFKAGSGISNEQMMALLIVAEQYGLNPWTKEIYAFPDKGGIVPVVGVDGWSRILNDHPQMDGVEFIDSPDVVKSSGKDVPTWIECLIYRKDRSKPTKVRERFSEVVRDTQPWKSHPSRMLRHKALIQCARIAFGFSGIYDEDEAQRIVSVDSTPVKAKAQAAQAMLTGQAEPVADAEIIDEATGEVLVEAGEQ